MMTISSEAGARLAKAKAQLDIHNSKSSVAKTREEAAAFCEALNEYCIASNLVANELVASNFHLMECN